MVAKKDRQEKPAHNGRFGASGGVARLTVCTDIQPFAPVRATVKPPPAPSHFYVVCNVRATVRCAREFFSATWDNV